MVTLKSINYNTRFCVFGIDSSDDLASLPTQTSSGKGTLSTIAGCCMGSIAHATDGNTYTLTGDTNQWIPYQKSSSNETGNIPIENISSITDEEIYSLFP